MPALTDARPFLRHIEALNRHNPADFLPFMISEVPVGLVRRDLAYSLAAYKNVFAIAETVVFLPDGTVADRTEALAGVVRDLAAKGLVVLRGEPYPVTTGWGEPLLATIDRGAYQFFGTLGFGVHVNGLVRKADGLHVWVAKRALDRSVAPGKLDNIIAGGLSSDYSAHQTLIKEAEEEAGLAADVAGSAIPVGAISYAYDMAGGVKRDTLFLYDLYLPEKIVPHNHDGEVESFTLMPVEDVIALVRDTDRFKPNINLAVMDMLIRHGYFAPDMPGYERLIYGLRRCR